MLSIKQLFYPFLFLVCFIQTNFATASTPGNKVVPKLHIEIAVNHCFAGGATLHAFNPLQPDNPQYYAQPHFLVVWKKNGQYVGTGTTLECVCGGVFTVRITDMRNGYWEERSVKVGPCRGTKEDPAY